MSKPMRLKTETIDACLTAIGEIPVSEIKYYLLLMLRTIQKKDDFQYQPLLEELLGLSKDLALFINLNLTHRDYPISQRIKTHYQALREHAKINTLDLQLGYALINLGSVLVAFIGGVIGGLMGCVAGLLRSLWTLNNPLVYFADGFITGFLLGALIGFRAPKKLFKDELRRQLKFCLDGIAQCIEKERRRAY